MQRLKRRFEAQHPDIAVELGGVPQWYYDKLQALIVADECPDVSVANYGRLAALVRAGAVLGLSGLVSYDRSLRRSCTDAAWQALNGLAAAIGRWGLWALPRDWPPAGLVLYNADLLATAAIELPRASVWTWGEFRQACEAVAKAGLADVYPAAINLYPYSVFSWLHQVDASLFSADGHVTADSAAVAEAIDFVLGLWRAGLTPRPSPGRDESFDLFRAGGVAFVFGTFYNVQACRDIEGFEWGAALPFKGQVWGCSCLPTYVAVGSFTPHPGAAFEWARFVSLQAARAYAKAELTTPAALDGLAPDGFLSQPPLSRARTVVLKAMRLARPRPRTGKFITRPWATKCEPCSSGR